MRHVMRFGGPIRAAAALAVAAALGSAPAAGAATCTRGGETVRAQNATVQVLTGRSGDFACYRRTGRRHRLGLDEEAAVDRVIVRGVYVAYLQHWYDGEDEATELDLLNVRTGGDKFLDAVSYASPGPFGSFVLRPTGATAWIVDYSWGDGGGNVGSRKTVRRCSARCLGRPGHPRATTLDEGRGIEMRSLRLRGATKVEWLRSGKRKRATLR